MRASFTLLCVFPVSFITLISLSLVAINSYATVLMIYYFIWLLRRPHEYPMLIAVSTLSPVRTQTLIPVSLNASIVSLTSSWSLSSMAVDPTRVMPVSISFCSFSTFSSFPTMLAKAY